MTCIRSILTYAAPVFYCALPQCLKCELKRVQKRAFSIIYPGKDYQEALDEAAIPAIVQGICRTLFNSIVENKDHKLNGLLPSINKTSYNLKDDPDTLRFLDINLIVLKTLS